jgi:hypothetical protein
MRNPRFSHWTRVRWTAIVAVIVLSPATIATAENWIAAGSGNWNTPGNWNPATVPSGGDTVTIGPFGDGVARTVAYVYTGAAVTLNELRVDLTGAGAAATTLSMSANNLTSSSEYIGYSITDGRGVFNHSGGINTIAAGAGFLDIGVFAGSTGTYNLSGTGALVANTHEYVGDVGTGFFNQTGGSNTINGAGNNLFLGYNASNTSPTGGTYTLSAGTLSVGGDQYVGYNRVGTFNQTGGTNTVGSFPTSDLFVGTFANSTGTYNHTGGTNTVGNRLFIATDTLSTGTYALGGTGILSARTESVGERGNGTFNQTGGTNNVFSELL